MSALPILDIEKKSFRILTSNFNSVLSKVGDRPFVLISINGATRTGKSYALNYFIRYLTSAGSWTKLKDVSKFVAKGGRKRTTLGIDLWSEPFIIKVDGREIAVLLMDCQGLFDDQTTGTQNAIIFSLSSLCSSLSVFNLMRNIDESSLQQIQFFSGYAHLVSRKKTENKEQGSAEKEQDEARQNPFQRLIFLIRDFEFPDYDYGYHGDLKSTSGGNEGNFNSDVFKSSAGVERPPENIFVREEILRSYKDVSCFLMPHPGLKFTRDENNPTEEEFNEYMKEFVEFVLSPQNLVTKRIGGQEITGNEFKKFVDEWARLCEKAEDHFPAVQTIHDTTVLIQNTLAVNTALSHYEKGMNSFVQLYPRGLSDSDFLKLHEKLQSEALEIFNGIKKLGGEESSKKYQSSLLEHIEKVAKVSRQLNLILLSKAATDEELEKNKEEVSKVQNQLSDLEVQNKRDKEKQEKVIKDLQEKMDQDKTANEEQRRFYQEQMTLAQNNCTQLTQAAAANTKLLTDQIAAMEKKMDERQNQHEQAMANHQREIQRLIDAQSNSGSKGGGFLGIFGNAVSTIANGLVERMLTLLDPSKWSVVRASKLKLL